MRKIVSLCLVLALATCKTSLAQDGLPPEVQADLLTQQIFRALQEKNLIAATELFEKQRDLEVKRSPDLLLLEAKTYLALAKSRRQENLDNVTNIELVRSTLALSNHSFREYFRSIEGQRKSSEGYDEALSLYAEVESLTVETERLLSERIDQYNSLVSQMNTQLDNRQHADAIKTIDEILQNYPNIGSELKTKYTF